MSALYPAPVLPTSDIVSPASIRTSTRSQPSSAAKSPFSNRGSASWSRPTSLLGGSISPPTSGWPYPKRPRFSSRSARRHGAAMVMPIFLMSRCGARGRDQRRWLHSGHHQVDRSRRHRRRRRAHHQGNQSDSGCGGGVQSGISPRRRSDPGFQAPGPHRHRTDDERARKVIAEIYRPLYLNRAPIMYTARPTAELIKYAANAFLAHQDHVHQRDRRSGLNALAPTCRRWRAAWASTIGSVPSFCMPSRLWRLLLSQGYPRAAEDRAGS